MHPNALLSLSSLLILSGASPLEGLGAKVGVEVSIGGILRWCNVEKGIRNCLSSSSPKSPAILFVGIFFLF